MKRVLVAILTAGAIAQFGFSTDRGDQMLATPDQADAYALEAVRPHYPRDLQMKGVAGRAVMKVIVAGDGSMAEIKVISSTYPQFGQAAREALSKWVFEPARRDGQNVAQTLIVPFDFVMEGDRREIEGILLAKL